MISFLSLAGIHWQIFSCVNPFFYKESLFQMLDKYHTEIVLEIALKQLSYMYNFHPHQSKNRNSVTIWVWILCLSMFCCYAFFLHNTYSLSRFKDHKNIQPSFIMEDFWNKIIIWFMCWVLHCLFQILFCDDAQVAASNRYVAAPKKYLY